MIPGGYTEFTLDLRWRLEWKTGRPAAFGFWNWPGDEKKPEGKAWLLPKEGLARAIVEAKDRHQRTISVAAECAGEDFIEFRWIAATAVPLGAGTRALVGRIQGMTLVSRTSKVSVYLDGRVHMEPNNETVVRSAAWAK